MTSRYRTALLLLLAGGALTFFGYGQTWVTITAQASGLPATTRALTGRDLEPGAGVLPLLLLATVLGVWATSGWVRRAVGAIAILAAAVALVGAVRSAPLLRGGDLSVRFELVGAPVYMGTWCWLAAALGAVVAGAGGVLVLLGSGAWPGWSARYQRRAAGALAGAVAGPLTQRGAWDQLDAGHDPTDPTVLAAPRAGEAPGATTDTHADTMTATATSQSTPGEGATVAPAGRSSQPSAPSEEDPR